MPRLCCGDKAGLRCQGCVAEAEHTWGGAGWNEEGTGALIVMHRVVEGRHDSKRLLLHWAPPLVTTAHYARLKRHVVLASDVGAVFDLTSAEARSASTEASLLVSDLTIGVSARR